MMVRGWGARRCPLQGAWQVISDELSYAAIHFLAAVGQKGNNCSPDLQ